MVASVCTRNDAALDAGPGAGRRGPRGPVPRAAARAAGAGEGQHRHRRPAHHGRLPGPGRRCRTRPATRRWCAGCARPGWSCSARPTSASGPTSATAARPPGGARYGGLTRNPYALNRSAGGSSSGSGAAVGGRHHAVRRRHRDRRLDLLPGGVQRLRRVQADGRPGAHRRRGAGLALAGLPRPDGDDGARRGRAARRARRRRHRLRVARRRRPARREADRRARGRRTGATAATPTSTPSGRSTLLAAEGATIVDDTDLDSHGGLRLERRAAGDAGRAAQRAGGLPRRPGPGDGPRTLADVVAFNREHADVELAALRPVAVRAGAGGPGRRQPGVRRGAGPLRAARPRRRHRRRAPEHRPRRAGHPVVRARRCPIDLVNPEAHAGSCTTPTAIAGYPLLTVPSGLAAGLPVAVSFWGTAGSEATLVEIAHGYEQARNRDTGPLPPPTFAPFV